MLSEIYPGVPPKKGSTYWDQILEVGVISVLKRILKRLHEFLDQVRSWYSFVELRGLIIIFWTIIERSYWH